MSKVFFTIAIFVCLCSVTSAFFGDDYYDNENGDNGDDLLADEDTGNVTAPTDDPNRSWSCSPGWTAYSGEGEETCIWLSNVTKNFDEALTFCRHEGGSLVSLTSREKSSFVKAAVLQEEKDFWIGLSKLRGYDTLFMWHALDGSRAAQLSSLPEQMREYLSYKGQCVTISSYTEEWEMDDCDSEYRFVCEKPIECAPGTFGRQCEQECHCAGEPCDPKAVDSSDDVSCKWGCERGWMGQACDKKKEDPEVKYFCIDSPDVGRVAYIRIYTKGVQYRSIYGVGKNRTQVKWCSTTTVVPAKSPNYDLVTINIPIDENSDAEMQREECIGERLYNNIYMWVIVIQENDGILLEHDLQVSIICDFNEADKLIRADQYATEGEPARVQQSIIQPESIQDDVVLEVIDAYSGQPISEAPIGTTVVLQMRYGQQDDSVLKGVTPYNCIATSPDGVHKKKLLNNDGCAEINSPVNEFNVDHDNIIQTPWFNLFAFEDEQNVMFQCSFQLCFDTSCKIGCRDQSKSKRMKRSAQNADSEIQHSTTRTIRVLPSIAPNKGGEAKPEVAGDHKMRQRPMSEAAEHHEGYMVYLNPITCTLFLLLLVVFLCMYLVFLRTLRNSITDIRREIEIKRSRDKFLNCGCPQKDKVYVGP